MTGLRDLDEVVPEHDGLARTVLDYTVTTKRLVDEAKRPGFAEGDLAPLAALIAVEDFERVGPFKDVMDWPAYAAFLAGWMPTSDWECSFRRVTEVGNLVFLELEERVGGAAVNSASVYEFDGAGKLRHLDVYLQMPGG